MSGRRHKKLRRNVKRILVEWLHSVIPDSADKRLINVDTLEEYLSDQKHVYLNRKFLLSAYSLKWIYKRVKRNPDLTFDQLKKDLKFEEGITATQQTGFNL